MAIKPKSRAHEDRIKALEARPCVGVRTMENVYAEITALHNRLNQLERRRWWQFWK